MLAYSCTCLASWGTSFNYKKNLKIPYLIFFEKEREKKKEISQQQLPNLDPRRRHRSPKASTISILDNKSNSHTLSLTDDWWGHIIVDHRPLSPPSLFFLFTGHGRHLRDPFRPRLTLTRIQTLAQTNFVVSATCSSDYLLCPTRLTVDPCLDTNWPCPTCVVHESVTNSCQPQIWRANSSIRSS